MDFFLSLSGQIFWECLETRLAWLWSCAAHCLTSSSRYWGIKNYSRSFLLGAEAITLHTAVKQKPLRKQHVGSEDLHMGSVALSFHLFHQPHTESTKWYSIQYKMGKMTCTYQLIWLLRARRPWEKKMCINNQRIDVIYFCIVNKPVGSFWHKS